jgi:hypothetical protein
MSPGRCFSSLEKCLELFMAGPIYGICPYISVTWEVNVGKYSIHGALGDIELGKFSKYGGIFMNVLLLCLIAR